MQTRNMYKKPFAIFSASLSADGRRWSSDYNSGRHNIIKLQQCVILQDGSLGLFLVVPSNLS